MSKQSATEKNGGFERLIEERLQAIREMVIFGASEREVIEMARRQWGLGPVTVQALLQRVRERIIGEATKADPVFRLELSQLQRDKLAGLSLRHAHEERERIDPRLLQALSALATAIRGVLDSRDRAAVEISQLVEERVRRDAVASAIEAPLADSSQANGKQTAGEAPPVENDVAANEAPEQPAGTGKTSVAPAATVAQTPLPQAIAERLGHSKLEEPKSHEGNGLRHSEPSPAEGTLDCAGCAAT